MLDPSFFDSAFFAWVVLPLLIFIARILDVTLGTARIILLSKGQKTIAPILGFFEVLIWIIAIGQIMQHFTNVAAYIGWAGGFALGNYVGIALEERLALGTLVVRIITVQDASALIGSLKDHGYGVTAVDARGTSGKVNLIYTIIKRKDLDDVHRLIQAFNPRAFYSVEDARAAREGVFPPAREAAGFPLRGLLGPQRKAP